MDRGGSMIFADLVETVRAMPSQVFADLLLGLPLLAFLLVVVHSAMAARRRHLRLRGVR
jgi:hypothetical protein